MANKLNWSPGHNGKGNFYKSGEISTWNIDNQGNPHHQQVGDADGSPPGFLFFITPEGGINDGGIRFNNTTPMTDDQVIAAIESEDPYLWDGRANDPSENLAGPRVEFEGGGYGHAYNLMNMAAVDKSNWPDCHAELKVPASVRRKIRKWVDRLKWPEGSEKDDAREYHITILSIDEYDDDFVDWMKDRIRGRSFHFKSTGMALFGPENDVVVLRLECPEWRELAIEWGEEAEARGLDPRRFPNGPRAHVSVGRSPEGKWPQGVPDPHIEFDTAKFNINKNSSIQWASGDGTCDSCGKVQIGKDSEDGIATCSNCGAQITILGGPKVSSSPSGELAQWLKSFESPVKAAPVSLHHDDVHQMQPQKPSPASQGHFVDPPSHPYKPYDWASEGDYNQLDRAARVSCFECGIDHPSDELCEEKKLAIPGKDFKEAEADWYERAWKEPGKARPFPDQPMHWRQDHATDVKTARWTEVSSL